MRALGISIFSVLSVAQLASAAEKKVRLEPEKQYAGKIVELRLEPATLALSDPFDSRIVVVLGKTPEGNWVDLSRVAEFKMTSGADCVARDAEGFFSPKKDGKVAASISFGGVTANLAIEVTAQAKARPISFVRDVMPMLSKAQCNSGPCHGTPKGKNGFKLSLRGYDPEWDHEQLVDDLSSRRFNRSRPRDSLMLLKPTQETPHEGGMRFSTDSSYYRMLNQWIVEGNTSDVGKVKGAVKLTVGPDRPKLLSPGMVQQMIVIATYADGSTRDVTKDAVYATNPEYVAIVDDNGRIQGARRGEAALLVRYEGNYSVGYVSVLDSKPGYQWAEIPDNNFIDTLVHKKLKSLELLPSELCSDEEFARRVWLDLVGLPPTVEETLAFVGDKSPSKEKRAKLIDRLLERPEYIDRWAYKWADLLQCNRKYLGETGVWSYRNWIRGQIAANRPINEFVHDLVTANGSVNENPAANYYRVAREPLVAMENTTHLFMGVRFNCNKCHDHPFERWTQAQHYELGAFFAGVGRKAGANPDEEVIFERRDAGEEVKHPRTGQNIPAKFPFTHAGGPNVNLQAPDVDRRKAMADWLTAPENPYFAKSIVNRFWSYFLGIGIIDPVDDIRSGNPPSNPELLDALVKDFIDHHFDMKHLMRTICNSRTYQLSISANKWNEDDKLNFSHALPRRLTAEQLQDSLSVAMGIPIKFPGLPAGMMAMQLPDGKVEADFLDQFGRPPRESVCECERVTEVSLRQALNLVNGPTIGDAIANQENRVNRLLKKNPTDAQIVEEAYLAILCRRPNASETKAGAEYLAGSKSKLEGTQDLCWALLNSPGFLFNR